MISSQTAHRIAGLTFHQSVWPFALAIGALKLQMLVLGFLFLCMAFYLYKALPLVILVICIIFLLEKGEVNV